MIFSSLIRSRAWRLFSFLGSLSFQRDIVREQQTEGLFCHRFIEISRAKITNMLSLWSCNINKVNNTSKYHTFLSNTFRNLIKWELKDLLKLALLEWVISILQNVWELLSPSQMLPIKWIPYKKHILVFFMATYISVSQNTSLKTVMEQP